MAFKNVTESKFRKATELEVGDSLTGYVIGTKHSEKYDQDNLIMQDADSGEEFVLALAGNLKYALQDGKIRIGSLHRFTRGEDRKNKRGQTVSNFTIERDDDDTVAVAATEMIDRGGPGAADVDSSSVADRARELARRQGA